MTTDHLPLTTDRLLLRRWRDDDREPFARINADLRTMEFFPAPLSRAESDALLDRLEASIDRHGFGFWAVELRDSGELAGFTGLNVPAFEAPFTPAVEIGWRLAPEHWGRGYASEAARAALAFGFERAGAERIVSFTAVLNERSQRVMERIGMRRVADGDFLHPVLPPDHRLAPHVLYELTAADWRR
jgi:ribosomal-protein-alanine N-acetyltransferase